MKTKAFSEVPISEYANVKTPLDDIALGTTYTGPITKARRKAPNGLDTAPNDSWKPSSPAGDS